jgi:hypothetical protein
MQGPRKMASGGIIAFAEGDSVPPAEETKIDEEEYRRLGMASMPNPRAKSAEKQAAMREAMGPGKVFGTKDTGSVPPAVKDDAKKPSGNLPIQNVPDPTSGIAALMKMVGDMGGGRGGGGGGGGGGRDGGLSAAAKKLADFSEKETPEQQAYRASALKRAQEFENYKSPAMSEAQREALEAKQYDKYQARSKPYFDMMQKLIDEEKAANNAGKDSEFYQMLGKMGGALMSSRGAFGPALGRAVGEGIDYSDKMNAARAAAERLRRQAQMDLVKARMADEKGDQKSAQDYINEYNRNTRDAARLELDARKASTEMLKDVAGSDTKRQIEGAKLSNAFDIAGMRNQHALEKAGLTSQLGLMNLALRMKGMEDKNLPTVSDVAKAEELADRKFMDFKRSPEAMKYISSIKELGGDNLLKAVNMGTMKPDNPKFLAAVEAAKKEYIKDLLKGTRTSGGSSGVTMGTDYAERIGAR